VSPGRYDLATGECANSQTIGRRNGFLIGSSQTRGSELYLVDDQIKVAGKPYYSHPKYPVFDSTVLNKTLLVSSANYEVAWANNTKLLCYPDVGGDHARFQRAIWGKTQVKDSSPAWQFDCPNSAAVAVCPNAVLIATPNELTALSLQDGHLLWKQSLPAAPVPWGVAVNREGKVIVTLEGGRVLCFG